MTADESACGNFYFKTIPARRCLVSEKRKTLCDDNSYVLILRSSDHPRLNFLLLADHFSFKEIGRSERIVSDECEKYY